MVSSLFIASSANAHHFMGGDVPRSGSEGFLSGFAHPIIGLDHLAFIIAIGFLSAVVRPGLFLALAFVVAAMAGTAIHLVGLAIPGVELTISASILLFGILLAAKRGPERLACHFFGNGGGNCSRLRLWGGHFWRGAAPARRLPNRFHVRPNGGRHRGLRGRKDRARAPEAKRTRRRRLETGGSDPLRDRSRPSLFTDVGRPLSRRGEGIVRKKGTGRCPSPTVSTKPSRGFAFCRRICVLSRRKRA